MKFYRQNTMSLNIIHLYMSISLASSSAVRSTFQIKVIAMDIDLYKILQLEKSAEIQDGEKFKRRISIVFKFIQIHFKFYSEGKLLSSR